MKRTCRAEIVNAFAALTAREGVADFALADVVRFMHRAGSPYPATTIRAHISHHMLRTSERPQGELERVSRGQYRLATGDSAPQQLIPARTGRERGLHDDPADRIRDVIQNFTRYSERFGRNLSFTGPSVYFHRKAIARARKLGVAEALRDDLFFDYMVATLTSWGMHRMGDTKTKIGDMRAIRSSFQSLGAEFERLSGIRIGQLDEAEASRLSEELWPLLKELTVGIGETKLVVNSKAVHHLLPDLIPPIDRRYTIWFLTNRTQIFYTKEASLFSLVLSTFAQIARARADLLAEMQDEREDTMDSSSTKIIDNVLVGYRLAQAPGGLLD